MKKNVCIRAVELSDSQRISEIYKPYVENSAISFETEAPSSVEMEKRILEITKSYPYLVLFDENKVLGFAYAHALRSRSAYAHSVESSIYIDQAYRGQGYGRMLYDELEKRLLQGPFTNLYACIAYPSQEDEYLGLESYKFHLAMGFDLVGHFHGCGTKFGHSYDIVYLEKILRR